MVDGAALMLTPFYGARASGFWGERGTNLLDTGAPFYDVYETADGGWIAFGAIEPQFYAALLRVLGLDGEDAPGPRRQGELARAQRPLRRRSSARAPATNGRALADGADACIAPVLTPAEAPTAPAQPGPRDVPRAARRPAARARAALLAQHPRLPRAATAPRGVDRGRARRLRASRPPTSRSCAAPPSSSDPDHDHRDTQGEPNMPIPEQRNLEAARGILAEWLATKLPGATDVEIGPIGGPAATGFSNETLLFDATWTEGGERRTEKLVLRVKPTRHTVFLESDFEHQYRVLEALGAGGHVRVPTMRWFEEDDKWLGAPFFVMDRVDGRAPGDSPPYTMEGWLLSEATPEQRRDARRERARGARLRARRRLARARLRLPRQAAVRRGSGSSSSCSTTKPRSSGRPRDARAPSWRPRSTGSRAHAPAEDPETTLMLGRRAHQQPAVRQRLHGCRGRRLGDAHARGPDDGPRVVALPRPVLPRGHRRAAHGGLPHPRRDDRPLREGERARRRATSSCTRSSPACASGS